MKGICFKEHLFHLTVQEIKKQTRRIISPQPDNIRSINQNLCKHPGYELSKKPWTPESAHHFLMHENKFINPRYKVGETVYLKEPYYIWDEWDPEDGQFSYKFDSPEKIVPFWENKLFMPKSAARHFIKITGLRAERLQDISEEDCIKEGILEERNWGNGTEWFTYCNGTYSFNTPREAYKDLIDEINGVGTWDNNPLVYVYDYKLLQAK